MPRNASAWAGERGLPGCLEIDRIDKHQRGHRVEPIEDRIDLAVRPFPDPGVHHSDICRR